MLHAGAMTASGLNFEHSSFAKKKLCPGRSGSQVRYTIAMTNRIIVWAQPGQEILLRDAIDEAQLELVGVGSDTPDGAAVLSEKFSVERLGDFRQVSQHQDVDLLWLASPAPIEEAERKLIREMNLLTISSEPRPGDIATLANNPDDMAPDVFLPLMRRSEGFQSALQALETHPPPQGILISFRSRPGEGTLFARLFDAMDLIDQLSGEVESVSATLAESGLSVTTSRPPVPETLMNLRGHMSLNVQFADNRCAAALLSNCSDSWFRGVTMLTDDGNLNLTDSGCGWSGDDGEVHEFTHTPVSSGVLVGRQILRLRENLKHTVPPPNYPRLLALCEAARLSCLTGQAESPARMLTMLSHV